MKDFRSNPLHTVIIKSAVGVKCLHTLKLLNCALEVRLWAINFIFSFPITKFIDMPAGILINAGETVITL